MGTFTNSEDQDKMPLNTAFHQGLHCLLCKKDVRTKNTIFFLKLYSDIPNMYNELSQVYCTKPEGRIHKYTKG